MPKYITSYSYSVPISKNLKDSRGYTKNESSIKTQNKVVRKGTEVFTQEALEKFVEDNGFKDNFHIIIQKL